MVSLTPERIQAEAADLEVRTFPWRRVVAGFCCAFTVVMIMMLCLDQDKLRTPQPIAATTTVEPIFTFGEQVFFTRGFYRDTTGKVVGWDEPSCTYTIATDVVIVDQVPEEHLHTLRKLEEIDDLFGAPLPAPET